MSLSGAVSEITTVKFSSFEKVSQSTVRNAFMNHVLSHLIHRDLLLHLASSHNASSELMLYHLYINLCSVCLKQFIPFPGDKPWQVWCQMKAHNTGKVEVIFLWLYDQ